MREPQARRQNDARWIWVEFPWMYGQDYRTTVVVCALDFVQQAARGCHSQPPAPAHRERGAEPVDDEWRRFDDSARPGRPHMRFARKCHLPDNSHRGHACVVREPASDQRVQRPQGPAADRPLGGAKPGDGPRAGSLQRVHARVQVRHEICFGQLRDVTVPEAVGANIMTAVENRRNEARIPLSDPSQHEERPVDARSLEFVEHQGRRALDPGRQERPARRCERRHAADVEPLFDVDGERVLHSRNRPGLTSEECCGSP